jgi:hypothetical protein
MTNKFAHRLPAGWAVPGTSSSGREQRAKQSTESFRWLPSTRHSRSNESGHCWREVIVVEEPLSSKRKEIMASCALGPGVGGAERGWGGRSTACASATRCSAEITFPKRHSRMHKTAWKIASIKAGRLHAHGSAVCRCIFTPAYPSGMFLSSSISEASLYR